MHFLPGLCRTARRFLCLFTFVLVLGAAALARDLVRPEPVGSMRKIWREPAVYVALDQLWQTWYDEYPSEDAYENWMYAARYAGNPQYLKLLDKGLRKYPGSPVLLYLKAVTQLVRHDPALRSSTLDYLQRAVALDPTYDDPWFSLVIEYMALERGKDLRTALGEPAPPLPPRMRPPARSPGLLKLAALLALVAVGGQTGARWLERSRIRIVPYVPPAPLAVARGLAAVACPAGDLVVRLDTLRAGQ